MRSIPDRKMAKALAILLFLMTASSLSAPGSWASDRDSGFYRIHIRGADIVLSEYGAKRRLSLDSSVKVRVRGQDIELDFAPFDRIRSRTLFKGRRDIRTGRYIAVWWHRNRPYETKLVYGKLLNGYINGTMILPRTRTGLEPGYLDLSFRGEKGIELEERPEIRPRPIPPAALKKPFKEDCIPFDPKGIEVEKVRGSWKIVEGNHWMFDFGPNRPEAVTALNIIKNYGMNQVCYVGRPSPSMTYLLADGRAPSGPYPGEDCISFDPARLKVEKVRGSWKITQGNMWLLDFGNKKAEAERALDIIRSYGFTHQCFVGRPDPGFRYWRK